MEFAALIIFAVIGAWAGWRTGTFIRGEGTSPLPGIIIGVTGAAAGGLLFWFLTRNIGGLTSSIVIAVLGGILLLYLMGFFKKAGTR
jgi:uncharacterized membrane protein YeaQ/YmgE (transglycosylase-associated protein family)